MPINSKSFKARHGLSVGDDTSAVEAITNNGTFVGVKVNPDRGGTGLGTYAVGDMLYSAVVVSAAGAGASVTQSLTALPISTAGKMLQVNSGATAPSWSAYTLPLAAGTAGNILRSDGTNYAATTATYPATTTINQILWSSAANTISGLATVNNAVLVTSGTGVPSLSATLPAHTVTTSVTVPTVYSQSGTNGTLTLRPNSTDLTGMVSIPGTAVSNSSTTGALVVAGGLGVAGAVFLGSTLSVTSNVTLSGTANSVGTITSGTWSGTNIALNKGGTNAALTAVAGGIVWSAASALAISAAGTAGQILLSGGIGAPTWTTATFPATAGASGTLLQSGGTNWANTTATYPSVATTAGTWMRADGANWVASTSTLANTFTAGRLVFSSASNTLSATTNLTWDESHLDLVGGAKIKVGGASLSGNRVFGLSSDASVHEYKDIVGGSGISVTHSVGLITVANASAVFGGTTPNAYTTSTYNVGQNVLIGSLALTPTKSITGATWATGTATFTSTSHGLANGTDVIISGMTPSGYNGAYTINNVTTHTFDASIAVNPGTYSGAGVAYYSKTSLDVGNALEIRAGAGTTLANMISVYASNTQDAAFNVFKVSNTGVVTTLGKLVSTTTDAVTAAVSPVAQLTHKSSGTTTAGFGTSIELITQTGASTLKTGASIQSVATNVGNGTEEFDIRLLAGTAGGAPSVVLVANASGLYGSTSPSVNMILSPTTNATNGILTINDLHTNTTTIISPTVSGTGTVEMDTISLVSAPARSVKYLVQVTQGSNFEVKEVLVIHNGATPQWVEYGTVTSGTIDGSMVYDFVIAANILKFRVSTTSASTTTIKLIRTYITQ